MACSWPCSKCSPPRGTTFEEREHAWHMDIADRLVAADSTLFRTTRRTYARLDNDEECAAASAWWRKTPREPGERGMAAKPALNLDTTRTQPTQPGLKVRGPEYLRIIYGPDYLDADHLATLKKRSVGRKRSLASREYALGIEGLRRAAAGEPLWRVHECAFSVSALESTVVGLLRGRLLR